MEKIIKMLEDKQLIIVVKKEGHVEYVGVDFIDDIYHFDKDIKSAFVYSSPMNIVYSLKVLNRIYPELSFSIAECINNKNSYREIDSIYDIINEENTNAIINNEINKSLQNLIENKEELKFKISFTINNEMKFLKQMPKNILSMKSVDEMADFLSSEFDEAKVFSPKELTPAPAHYSKNIHKGIFDMLKTIKYIFETNYLPPIYVNNLFHQIVRDEINESAKEFNII